MAQKFWHFWRHWYPHLFFLFCFEELGKFVHLVTPGWQDAKLIAADYWLTGVHPTVWLEQFATPVRNDFERPSIETTVSAAWELLMRCSPALRAARDAR